MIKGLLIFKTNGGWKLLADYVPAAEEKPTQEVITTIMNTFKDPTVKLANYRQFPYKYFCFQINPEAPATAVGIYILENTDTVDIVRLFLSDIQKSIVDNLGNSKQLAVLLKQIVEGRNHILEKLDKPKLLQDEIGASANSLIDKGEFVQAQARIKLAKEVPGEIYACYKKAAQAIKDKDFRKAEKPLSDSYNWAQKIQDAELSQYFTLKLENVRNIPQYEKEVKTLYNQFNRALSKNITNIPYGDQIGRLERCYELLDVLENDDKMQQIQELETTIKNAQETLDQLNVLDSKIKIMLKNFPTVE
jgi:hypothetical protein